jgi:hypothetical protein
MSYTVYAGEFPDIKYLTIDTLEEAVKWADENCQKEERAGINDDSGKVVLIRKGQKWVRPIRAVSKQEAMFALLKNGYSLYPSSSTKIEISIGDKSYYGTGDTFDKAVEVAAEKIYLELESELGDLRDRIEAIKSILFI